MRLGPKMIELRCPPLNVKLPKGIGPYEVKQRASLFTLKDEMHWDDLTESRQDVLDSNLRSMGLFLRSGIHIYDLAMCLSVDEDTDNIRFSAVMYKNTLIRDQAAHAAVKRAQLLLDFMPREIAPLMTSQKLLCLPLENVISGISFLSPEFLSLFNAFLLLGEAYKN